MAALQNIKQQAGQTIQQAVQATAKQIRDQSTEILKSGSSQIYPVVEYGIEQPQASGQPSIIQNLQNPNSQNPNPQEIKRREDELLAMWRQRLTQIVTEQNQATQNRQEQYQAWYKQQSELMQEPISDAGDDLPQSTSKPRGPMAQGGKQRVQAQISMKTETGRGAKN